MSVKDLFMNSQEKPMMFNTAMGVNELASVAKNALLLDCCYCLYSAAIRQQK